jgi:hypothetical protein
VAGALWRPGDLCVSVGRQWAIEWLRPTDKISSYRMRDGAVQAFRPLVDEWSADGTEGI